MYISSNPIEPDAPVIFDLRPAEDVLQTITRGNLRTTAPVVLKSTEWATPITRKGGSLDFEVEYRRYWDLEKNGNGWNVIQSESCRIPVSQKN